METFKSKGVTNYHKLFRIQNLKFKNICLQNHILLKTSVFCLRKREDYFYGEDDERCCVITHQCCVKMYLPVIFGVG